MLNTPELNHFVQSQQEFMEPMWVGAYCKNGGTVKCHTWYWMKEGGQEEVENGENGFWGRNQPQHGSDEGLAMLIINGTWHDAPRSRWREVLHVSGYLCEFKNPCSVVE